MLSCDAGKIKLAESMSRFCNEEEGGLVVHGMASKKVPYDEMPSRLDGPERPATGAVLPASMTPPCTGQSTAPKPSRSAPPQRSTSPQTRSPTLWLLLRRDHRRSTQSPHLLLKRRSCLHNRSARKLKWNSRANALTPPIWIPTPPDPGGRWVLTPPDPGGFVLTPPDPGGVNEKVGRQRERDQLSTGSGCLPGRRRPSTGSGRIYRFSDAAEPPGYRRLAGLAARSRAGDAPPSRCCIERVTKSARSSSESPSSPKPV